ncbi:hypothetical protein ACLBWX_18580 [Methylobacterium sp. M6A4_1b]
MSEMHSTHGTIWALFGHRLAIEGPDGRILVDLGPEGARALARRSVTLKVGNAVAVTGERRPTEIKAAAITGPDGLRHAIAHPGPKGKDEASADPATALAALRQAGYQAEGVPARKPKHFEVRASKDGGHYAVHVTFAGVIRKAEALPDSSVEAG